MARRGLTRELAMAELARCFGEERASEIAGLFCKVWEVTIDDEEGNCLWDLHRTAAGAFNDGHSYMAEVFGGGEWVYAVRAFPNVSDPEWRVETPETFFIEGTEQQYLLLQEGETEPFGAEDGTGTRLRIRLIYPKDP